jgi:hypothetical protein
MSVVKERYRLAFTVPSTSGGYAFERITFGAVRSGQPEDSFQGVTAMIEGSGVATAVLELWLPRLDAGSKHPSDFIDSDYSYAGKSVTATGGETWPLAGYPGAQIRVKSGGTSGTMTVSATAF